MIKKEVVHRFVDQLYGDCETFPDKSKVQEHFLNTKKEWLLGIQSFIRCMIDEIEKKEQKQSPDVPQAKKIDVEDD